MRSFTGLTCTDGMVKAEFVPSPVDSTERALPFLLENLKVSLKGIGLKSTRGKGQNIICEYLAS